jgi:hypothetical protein
LSADVAHVVQVNFINSFFPSNAHTHLALGVDEPLRALQQACTLRNFLTSDTGTPSLMWSGAPDFAK